MADEFSALDQLEADVEGSGRAASFRGRRIRNPNKVQAVEVANPPESTHSPPVVSPPVSPRNTGYQGRVTSRSVSHSGENSSSNSSATGNAAQVRILDGPVESSSSPRAQASDSGHASSFRAQDFSFVGDQNGSGNATNAGATGNRQTREKSVLFAGVSANVLPQFQKTDTRDDTQSDSDDSTTDDTNDDPGSPSSPNRKKGSNMEADLQLLELTENEIAQLEQLFESVDDNQNGLLSVGELAIAMKRLGFSISKAQLIQLIREVTFETYSEEAFGRLETDKTFWNQHRRSSAGFAAASRNSVARSKSVVSKMGNSFASRKSVAHSKEEAEHIEIDFTDFVKIMALWQGAARFQIFEERSQEISDHIELARSSRFMLPDAYFMWVWNALLLFCIGYTFFVVLMHHVWTNVEEQMWLFSVSTGSDFVVFLFMAVDVLVQFHTAVQMKEETRAYLVDDRLGIAKHYMAHWFLVDLFAALPLRFFFFFGGSTSEPAGDPAAPVGSYSSRGAVGGWGSEDVDTFIKVAIWLNHLRLLKTLKINYLYKSSLRVQLSANYVTFNYAVAQALTQLLKFGCLVHLLAVVLVNVGSSGYVYVGQQYVFLDPPRRTYANAVYTTLNILSSAGFGDDIPASHEERIWFMLVMVIGLLLNGIVVGSIVGFFQRADIDTARKTKIMELSAVLEYFDMPESLTEEILRLQNHLLMTDMMRTHASIVCNLPPEIQHNLELFVRVRAISAVSFFQDIHNSAKIFLCQQLISVVFCPEEMIIAFGEFGEEMFFINYGFVDVLTRKFGYIGTLKSGDYFGETALLSDEPLERTASVKSISYCDLFVLKKTGFQDVLMRYPRFRAKIEEVAKNRLVAAKKAAMREKTRDQKAMASSGAESTNATSSTEPSSVVAEAIKKSGQGNAKDRSISIISMKLRRPDNFINEMRTVVASEDEGSPRMGNLNQSSSVLNQSSGVPMPTFASVGAEPQTLKATNDFMSSSFTKGDADPETAAVVNSEHNSGNYSAPGSAADMLSLLTGKNNRQGLQRKDSEMSSALSSCSDASISASQHPALNSMTQIGTFSSADAPMPPSMNHSFASHPPHPTVVAASQPPKQRVTLDKDEDDPFADEDLPRMSVTGDTGGTKEINLSSTALVAEEQSPSSPLVPPSGKDNESIPSAKGHQASLASSQLKTNSQNADHSQQRASISSNSSVTGLAIGYTPPNQQGGARTQVSFRNEQFDTSMGSMAQAQAMMNASLSASLSDMNQIRTAAATLMGQGQSLDALNNPQQQLRREIAQEIEQLPREQLVEFIAMLAKESAEMEMMLNGGPGGSPATEGLQRAASFKSVSFFQPNRQSVAFSKASSGLGGSMRSRGGIRKQSLMHSLAMRSGIGFRRQSSEHPQGGSMGHLSTRSRPDSLGPSGHSSTNQHLIDAMEITSNGTSGDNSRQASLDPNAPQAGPMVVNTGSDGR